MKPRYLLWLSLVCYAGSLYWPAFGCHYFGADSGRYTVEPGWVLLWGGWLGLLTYNVAWFANLTFIITWLCLGLHSPKAKGFAIASLVLGLSALSLYFFDKDMGVYTGFYLWIASFLVLVLACIARHQNQKSTASIRGC